MWCGTQTQRDLRQLVHPVTAGAAGTQGGFEALVEPLHYPVALRVVGGGGDVDDPQQVADSTPDSGSELGAAVRCEDCWHAKALEEGLRAVGG